MVPVPVIGDNSTIEATLLVVLIAALIAKEVMAHAGNPRLFPLHRMLSFVIVPLAVVVCLILIHRISSLL